MTKLTDLTSQNFDALALALGEGDINAPKASIDRRFIYNQEQWDYLVDIANLYI